MVFKLFEFMHETFPGVQPFGRSEVSHSAQTAETALQPCRQMAVDTFLRICQKCKKKFITQQACGDVSRCADQCAMFSLIRRTTSPRRSSRPCQVTSLRTVKADLVPLELMLV